MWFVPIINGPNLNLTGVRQPEIYGSETFEILLNRLTQDFPKIQFALYQSQYEGDLIQYIQDMRHKAHAAILNPGGLTHTSVALRDAVAALCVPVAEVHLSNIQEREDFRKISLFKEVCFFQITGLGIQSYWQAAARLNEYLNTVQPESYTSSVRIA